VQCSTIRQKVITSPPARQKPNHLHQRMLNPSERHQQQQPQTTLLQIKIKHRFLRLAHQTSPAIPNPNPKPKPTTPPPHPLTILPIIHTHCNLRPNRQTLQIHLILPFCIYIKSPEKPVEHSGLVLHPEDIRSLVVDCFGLFTVVAFDGFYAVALFASLLFVEFSLPVL
jgi:hypothetical protein